MKVRGENNPTTGDPGQGDQSAVDDSGAVDRGVRGLRAGLRELRLLVATTVLTAVVVGAVAATAAGNWLILLAAYLNRGLGQVGG